MRLNGKAAVVTGAARGIGRAIALKLASEGAAVTVSDILSDEAEAVARLIRERGGRALAAKTDVCDMDEVTRLMADTAREFGSLDILVNNAGGLAGWLGMGGSNLADSKPEVWKKVLEVNLTSVFNCTYAALPYMLKKEYGKIINMASVAGVVGISGFVDYSAAKGGVIAMTQALAMEAGEHNITVNCISPGAVLTHGTYMPRATYLGREDARKNGAPEDIAELTLFLASPESDFITGQNHVCDGGRVLGPKL